MTSPPTAGAVLSLRRRGRPPFRRRPLRELPFFVVALGGSLIVAAASLAVAEALSYDAWGWLLWGQEILGGRKFTTDGYPSWKPLTGLASVLLAPLGDAGPVAWLVIARAGALMALVLAYRLAARTAGHLAGALAAAALLIVPQWLFQAGVAGSEPLLTALLLGAVDRHANGHDRSGFVLALLASLLRPESWPALLVSAIVTWRRRPRSRPFLIAGIATVPVLWFGGEWLGSGDPFRGGELAKQSLEAQQLRHASTPPAVGVLDRFWRMVPMLLLVCAPVALVNGFRRRDPILLALMGGALVWLGEVVVLSAMGYAGVSRFLFPAAAALAVVGAAGVEQLLRWPRLAPVLRVALAAGMVALALTSVKRAEGLGRQGRTIDRRVGIDRDVERIVDRMGRNAFLDAPHVWAQGVTITPLAWRLDVPAESIRHPGLPGLAVRDLSERWPAFELALRSARGKLRPRTLMSYGKLRLISVEPRRR